MRIPTQTKVEIVCRALCAGLLLTWAAEASQITGAVTPANTAPASPGECASAEETYKLARSLFKGDGIRKDFRRSLELMRQAAEAGHPEATGAIGIFYRDGLGGVERDPNLAVEWFRKGIEKGALHAEVNYGQMLLDGDGIGPDVKEGLERVGRAAEAGLPDAHLILGRARYRGGYGLPVDYKTAFAHFLKAAEAGNSDARNMLGVMYQNGLGVEADEEAAIGWFRKAAGQNLPKAQSNLGALLGPNADDRERRLEALTWLYVAARQREVTATKRISSVRLSVGEDELNEAKGRAKAFLDEWARRNRPGLVPQNPPGPDSASVD